MVRVSFKANIFRVAVFEAAQVVFDSCQDSADSNQHYSAIITVNFFNFSLNIHYFWVKIVYL